MKTAAAIVEPARELELHTDNGETCTVVLDATDALAVGQSLRALARDPRTPHGTREIFARVGGQMTAGARVAIAQRGGR